MADFNPSRKEVRDKILNIVGNRKNALQRVENDLIDMFKRYVKEAKLLIASGKGQKSLGAMTKQINELANLLEAAGFEDVVKVYLRQFEKLTRDAIGYYSLFGKPDLAGISTATLNAYIRFTEGELRNIVSRKLVAPLQSALLQANYAGASRDEVYQTVSAIEPTLRPDQVVTTVDDAFSSYQRAVIVEAADVAGLEIYQYLGPEDDITSEQCLEMLNIRTHGVPGMLPKDEITVDLHPNLTRNPLIGGGHPRCRHQWSPVTEEYAKAQGYKP